jgi:tetraacyldisaccharide 4'-kinase
MIERTLRKIWYDGNRGPELTMFMRLLVPVSMIYKRMVAIKNKRFDLASGDISRLPCRIVSVGNLTAGGTGKTPLVIHLARVLQKRGFRPAVLSRGYGGRSKQAVNLVSGGAQVLMSEVDAGDEPVLIAKSLTGVPVVTGRQRSLAGDWALKNLNTDILILDDGFQHRSLGRDIDIVLLNAGNPFGNGYCLPAGPLREPPDALKRADVIIMTGTYEDVASMRSINPLDDFRAPVFSCYYKPREFVRCAPETVFPPEFVKGKSICAFAGIGNPDAFAETLVSLGARLNVFMPFPDHHRYSKEDISLIAAKALRCGAEMIVTTEKDLIKLDRFDDLSHDIYALRIEMEFLSGGEDFERLLLAKLHENH